MNCFFYTIFSAGLYLWTIQSLVYEDITQKGIYLAAILLLFFFVTAITFSDRKRKCCDGVVIAALFMNIGLSIDYRMFQYMEMTDLFTQVKQSYFMEMIFMLLFYVIGYELTFRTTIYRWKKVHLLILVSLPVFLFGARISGRLTGGSYLYFSGIMVFGLVLIGFPFVIAFFASLEERRYRSGNVKNLSWNLLSLLLYTFVLYFGCVLCKEYGLLLILGLTTTVIFYIRCKNMLTKICYTAACAGGAILASTMMEHISIRLEIWLNPVQAYYNEELAEAAESVLYFFRHIMQMGWWGKGIGNLSKLFYPTLNTDHALVTLVNDYSIFVALFVVILGVFYVRWMLIVPEGLCSYDWYLNFSCSLIFCFIILLDIGSNTGSFITSGIGFPWVSEGGSVNIMLTWLMGIHCGLYKKGIM